jgi:prophage regulatory protein
MQTNTSPQPTILRRRQVEQRTGLPRSTLYQYIKDGDFPLPVRLGLRAVGWLESDISEWIAARVKQARPGGDGCGERSSVRGVIAGKRHARREG